MWAQYANSERCPCAVTSSSCALFVGLASAWPLSMLLLWKKLHLWLSPKYSRGKTITDYDYLQLLSTVLVGACMLFVSLVLFVVVWALHARYWRQHKQRTAATAGLGSVQVKPFTWHAWFSALLFGFAPIPSFDALSGQSSNKNSDGNENDMFEQHRILRVLFVIRGIFLAAGIWFITRGLADFLIGDSNKSFGRQFFYHLFAAAISEEFGKLCAAASVLACLRYRRLPLALPMAAMLCGAIFGIYENYTYFMLGANYHIRFVTVVFHTLSPCIVSLTYLIYGLPIASASFVLVVLLHTLNNSLSALIGLFAILTCVFDALLHYIVARHLWCKFLSLPKTHRSVAVFLANNRDVYELLCRCGAQRFNEAPVEQQITDFVGMNSSYHPGHNTTHGNLEVVVAPRPQPATDVYVAPPQYASINAPAASIN
ncbi:MAG: hypothetical protein MHM6MM_003988 [Cercozoa sp. M6MM]